MNPLDWLQDNIFYTDAKKKEINDAAYKNNRQVPSMMTPGQTYVDASYSQQQKTDAINSGVKSAIGLDKKPSQVMGPGGPGGFGMGNSSNPVRPSQPAGEPTAYAQHAGTTYYQLPDGRDVYQTSDGSTYDRATGQQVGLSKTTGESGVHDGAFSKKGKGFSAYEGTNLRNEDNQVIEKGTQVWKVPDSTLKTGGGGGNRDNSRVVPGSGGMVQKGTDMGRSFNDLLAAQGNQRYTGFNSSQLPETQGNPFSGTAPKTDTFNPAAPGITGAPYDNYGADGGAAAASSTDKSQFTPMSGKKSRIEGASERPKGGRLDAALADKAGINSYMEKFSGGNRERAARSAFLNAEDSLKGLQARDAVNDVVYAGGQHYGRDGDGTFELDRADARQVASGKAKAQDFLKSKIDTTVDTQKQTPSEAQDPLSAAGSAVKSGFAAGAATDFGLNNNQAAPQTGVGPVVPTDQIPKDLSGAAGKKFLADLDAGRLFK